MKLLMSYTSPYARKVRVFLRELKLEDMIDEVPVDPISDPDELISVNPAAKIPALVTEDGLAVHDSRVILGYLASLKDAGDLYPRPNDPKRWAAMTLAAHIDAILDSALAWRMEQMRQPGERSIFWQGRWQGQIARALDALPERLEQAPAYRPYAEMLSVVALEYLDFRHPSMNWQEGRGELVKLHDDWAARPSMVETQFPKG
ncbi:glutathione S-transferase N-terminal domain-containing protein [Pacificimonas sp. WHA3]|uniref:Glutathione S-transferase N-terminal domain-containing protein n=1 Tax=Pacificimonas pallii TaxID=2827236 RepID=A0ABS6SBB5_9SPHN|nr:glutathione S-transferase N-terminal domain-containing protein [Pacificimonas pallii]MBV7255718.1 glutathione S-transferase N-terminal domain-containing protein [Pacificimonas pallii]